MLIGFGQLISNRHSIEDTLMDRSADALSAAGLDLTACFSGRDATVSGAGSAADFERAVSIVRAIDGVRVVHTKIGSADPDTGSSVAPAVPSVGESPLVPVGFTLDDGTITVTGTVPSKAERTGLIAAATAAGKDWAIVDRLTVDAALTTISPARSRFRAVTDLLAQAPIDGTLLVIQYQPDSVILRGTPATAAAERSLLTAATATVGTDAGVMDGLDVPAS